MISKFFIIFSVFTRCAVASDDLDLQKNRNTTFVIIQIVAKQAESICHYKDGKLYLKAEKIHPTNAGAVLYNNNSAILLQNLFLDQMGYYLPCRSRDDYQFTCRNCGRRWWFSDRWNDLCPVCQIPGD